MPSDNVTIYDLAKELKLSPSTVSRAMRDHSNISKATKEKVLTLARKMGYQPNPFAKSLIGKSTAIIGLIIPNIYHSYFVEVLDGILSSAYEHGLQVMICHTNDNLEREKKQISTLLASRVAGALVCYSSETVDFSHFQSFLDKDIPLVFFDRNTEDLDIPAIITDDFQGGCIAVQHLINRGRSKILHFRGPEALSISFYRYLGYRQTLAENNLPLRQEWVIDAVDVNGNKPTDMEKMDHALKEVDAVFAFNDYAAFTIIQRLRVLGRRVPEEVAVVGYGDMQFSEFVTPSITTVHQPAFMLGEKSMSLLKQKIDLKNHTDPYLAPKLPSIDPIPNSLIIRKSS